MPTVNSVVKERSKIIGGSDVAGIMGMNRWKTPLSLWAEKTGKIESLFTNFEAAEIGTELEEYVARKFAKKTGFRVRRDNRTFKHKDYDYMVAHIDRWIVGEDALLECKTCSAWKEKEWQDEDIPQEYVIQVMWYLGILRKKRGYIAVLIGGQKFIWKMIEFDQKLFDKMVNAAYNFMENHIKNDVAPMAMEGDSETLISLFPEASEETIEFEGVQAEHIDNLIEERTGGIQAVKDAEAEIDKIKSQLKQYLGDAVEGSTGQHRFTWKNQRTERVDTKLLRQDGLFDNYKKVSEFRVLRTYNIKKAVKK